MHVRAGTNKDGVCLERKHNTDKETKHQQKGKRDARPPATPERESDETTRQSKRLRKAKRGGSKPDGDSDEEKDGDKARKQSWIYGLQQRRSK